MNRFSPSAFTDLASEIKQAAAQKVSGGVQKTEVVLSKRDATLLKKRAGRYVCITSQAVTQGKRKLFPKISRAITSALDSVASPQGTVLVVGLGNEALTADKLGGAVVRRIAVSRFSGRSGVCTLLPGVLGCTGIESFDVISGVISRISPSLVLAVDSLCAASPIRLASVFQITDAGITPGSGVGNARPPLNADTLGVPVISVGVPLVVYANEIIRAGGGTGKSDLIVTPKDVNLLVEDCAEIIARGINDFLANL